MISIVIGSLNRKRYLELTIKTLRQELSTITTPHEIFVVDGGSDDGTIEWLMCQKDIISIIQYNRGDWLGQKIEKKSWGYFMNLGFKAASGKYIVMLSDDCLVVPGAIKNSVAQFEKCLEQNINLGAIAYFWRNWPDMKNYWVGKTLDGNLMVNHGIYLKEALKKVEYIDSETFKFYCADGDLCLKMWELGYKIIPAENSFVEHFLEANPKQRKINTSSENSDFAKYYSKWAGKFTKDHPEANSNLFKDFSDPFETFKLFSTVSVVDSTRSRLKASLRKYRTKFKT